MENTQKEKNNIHTYVIFYRKNRTHSWNWIREEWSISTFNTKWCATYITIPTIPEIYMLTRYSIHKTEHGFMTFGCVQLVSYFVNITDVSMCVRFQTTRAKQIFLLTSTLFGESKIREWLKLGVTRSVFARLRQHGAWLCIMEILCTRMYISTKYGVYGNESDHQRPGWRIIQRTVYISVFLCSQTSLLMYIFWGFRWLE